MSCFHHHVDCDYTKFFFVDIVIEAMYHISLMPSKNASNINRVKPRFMQCFAKYVQPPQWLQILLWAGQFSHWLSFNQFSQMRQLLTLRPLISFAVFFLKYLACWPSVEFCQPWLKLFLSDFGALDYTAVHAFPLPLQSAMRPLLKVFAYTTACDDLHFSY